MILLSSQHRAGLIEDDGKSETVNAYNQTKAGVDTLDQLYKFYTTKRRSKNWPVVLFYNMLDTAAYNAFVMFTSKYIGYLTKYKTKARKNIHKRAVNEI